MTHAMDDNLLTCVPPDLSSRDHFRSKICCLAITGVLGGAHPECARVDRLLAPSVSQRKYFQEQTAARA